MITFLLKNIFLFLTIIWAHPSTNGIPKWKGRAFRSNLFLPFGTKKGFPLQSLAQAFVIEAIAKTEI
jgi:hypothetical protein